MASSSPIPSLKIIESSRVGLPPNSTPNFASIPLTHFDVPWSIIPPVERLFFYRFPHPTSHFLSSSLPSLKSSLSLTLAKFYPLAGVIRPTSSRIYCTEEDSVSFTVAEYDDDFEHLSSQQARLVSRLDPLVPSLKRSAESKELIAVQATVFPNQGFVIGIAVDHQACDGTSSLQFIQSWATTCHSGEFDSSLDPVINRGLISDPTDLYSFISKLTSDVLSSYGENKNPSPIDPDMVQATFTFKRDHIQRLKKVIMSQVEEGDTSFHCSTLVVAFAFAWIAYAKARGGESNNKHSLIFPADFRGRLQPPLPVTYFGNSVGACIVQVESDDLLSENGLFLAAEATGKSIKGLCMGPKFREDWAYAFELFTNPHVLSVAGSPKFMVYQVDFGWGRPVRVDIISVSKTGALAVAESKEEQGGVEIGLGLPRHVMERFEKYFVSALEI